MKHAREEDIRCVCGWSGHGYGGDQCPRCGSVERRQLSDVVSCESYPAYREHIREIGDRPVNLGGHQMPGPMSLCGRQVRWDCRIPVAAIECRECQEELRRRSNP